MLTTSTAQESVIAEALEMAQTLDIHVCEPEAMRRYLGQHPQLAQVLPDVLKCVREQLPDASLVLEVYTDPEVEDVFLTIYARWAKYDASVQTRLQGARDAYRPLLPAGEGWVFLTTDYKATKGDV